MSERGVGQPTNDSTAGLAPGKRTLIEALPVSSGPSQDYKKEAGDPYHALPEEADAWAVAGKLKTAYTKK